MNHCRYVGDYVADYYAVKEMAPRRRIYISICFSHTHEASAKIMSLKLTTLHINSVDVCDVVLAMQNQLSISKQFSKM